MGIDGVRLRHELFVPPVVSGLVPANKQDANPARVKSIQHPLRTALMLNSQFSHILIPGAVNRVGLWPGECRPGFLQDVNAIGDAVLLFGGQSIPPIPEFIREFDLPDHRDTMTLNTYAVERIPGPSMAGAPGPHDLPNHPMGGPGPSLLGTGEACEPNGLPPDFPPPPSVWSDLACEF